MIEAVIQGLRPDGDVGGAIATIHAGPDGSFQTSSGSYIGGQPAGLGASGFVFGTGVTDANYIGMFYNNALIDTNVGGGNVVNAVDLSVALPTILWKGPVKVRMNKGTRHNVADARAPFASGVTWALGDHLYIGPEHGGEWTNVQSDTHAVSHGRVLVPPASVDETLEAIMFDTPVTGV